MTQGNFSNFSEHTDADVLRFPSMEEPVASPEIHDQMPLDYGVVCLSAPEAGKHKGTFDGTAKGLGSDYAPESVRPNQDAVVAEHDPELSHCLFGVADGMGGHNGGEIASDIVASTFKFNYGKWTRFNKESGEEVLFGQREFEEAMRSARIKISAEQDIQPELEGMGSTATFASIEGNKLRWVNAGDSKLMVVRGDNIVHETHEQMRPEQPNIITNCIDGRSLSGHKDEFGSFDLEDGDRVVIVSDGVLGDVAYHRLSHEDIVEAVNSEEDPQEAALALVKKSKKDDDTSAIVVNYHSPKSKAADDGLQRDGDVIFVDPDLEKTSTSRGSKEDIDVPDFMKPNVDSGDDALGSMFPVWGVSEQDGQPEPLPRRLAGAPVAPPVRTHVTDLPQRTPKIGGGQFHDPAKVWGKKPFDRIAEDYPNKGDFQNRKENLEAKFTNEFNEARLAYIDAAAKSRNRTVDIRGRRELQEARVAYEAARNRLCNFTFEQFRKDGVDQAKAEQLALAVGVDELLDVEQSITQRQIEMSDDKRLKRVYDLWARHSGHRLGSTKWLKGVLVKGAMTGGIGAAVGIGIALTPLSGLAATGLAGGTAAGALATRVTRKLASTKMKQEAGAQMYAEKSLQKFNDHVQDATNLHMTSANLVAMSHEHTVDVKRRNALRMLGGVAAGVAVPLAIRKAWEYGGDFIDSIRENGEAINLPMRGASPKFADLNPEELDYFQSLPEETQAWLQTDDAERYFDGVDAVARHGGFEPGTPQADAYVQANFEDYVRFAQIQELINQGMTPEEALEEVSK